MNELSPQKWFLKCIITLFTLISFVGILVIVVDPYFHYHKPFPQFSYRLYEERYINDGISRHFDYDAVITGTSMTQNFRPSEFNDLFHVRSIKQPFPGAGYQEITENLSRTLARNSSVSTVLWALDYNGLLREYDWKQYEEYPTYLYDENPFNDVSYLFNKSILYHGVMPNLALTAAGSPSTTMDEYSTWERECGLSAILSSYDPWNNIKDPNSAFTEADAENVYKTITENFVNLVKQYPDITFYIFYPPYSICYWDDLYHEDLLNKHLAAEQIATTILLDCPNVKLYNFFDQYDIICNTDYYSDVCHYNADINSFILQWIYEGTGLVTKDNYQEKLQQEYDFFTTYDYYSLYK